MASILPPPRAPERRAAKQGDNLQTEASAHRTREPGSYRDPVSRSAQGSTRKPVFANNAVPVGHDRALAEFAGNELETRPLRLAEFATPAESYAVAPPVRRPSTRPPAPRAKVLHAGARSAFAQSEPQAVATSMFIPRASDSLGGASLQALGADHSGNLPSVSNAPAPRRSNAWMVVTGTVAAFAAIVVFGVSSRNSQAATVPLAATTAVGVAQPNVAAVVHSLPANVSAALGVAAPQTLSAVTQGSVTPGSVTQGAVLPAHVTPVVAPKRVASAPVSKSEVTIHQTAPKAAQVQAPKPQEAAVVTAVAAPKPAQIAGGSELAVSKQAAAAAKTTLTDSL